MNSAHCVVQITSSGGETPPAEHDEVSQARLRAVTQGLHGLAAAHLAEQAYSAAITEQLEHRMQVGRALMNLTLQVLRAVFKCLRAECIGPP